MATVSNPMGSSRGGRCRLRWAERLRAGRRASPGRSLLQTRATPRLVRREGRTTDRAFVSRFAACVRSGLSPSQLWPGAVAASACLPAPMLSRCMRRGERVCPDVLLGRGCQVKAGARGRLPGFRVEYPQGDGHSQGPTRIALLIVGPRGRCYPERELTSDGGCRVHPIGLHIGSTGSSAGGPWPWKRRFLREGRRNRVEGVGCTGRRRTSGVSAGGQGRYPFREPPFRWTRRRPTEEAYEPGRCRRRFMGGTRGARVGGWQTAE